MGEAVNDRLWSIDRYPFRESSEYMKKGDISKFVEDAVRWRMLDRTVQGIKDRNQDIRPEDLNSIIDHAVGSVRSSRANHPKARTRARK